MGKPVALRTSLIWHDEVMGDVVSERPQEITIGPFEGSTFITPSIGLPREFAIVRPGRRGHVLALGEQMRGTVCIGGIEQDVASLVMKSDTPGFFASAIGGLDWGVIELDASGAHKVFFQFVPLDEDVPTVPKPVMLASAAGYAISAAVLSLVWLVGGYGLGEAIFRGAGLATLALGGAALVRWVLKQDTDSRASLAFSAVLHAVILFATYNIYAHESAVKYPDLDLTAHYIPTRLLDSTPQPAIAAAKPTIDQTVKPMTAAPPLVDIPRPPPKPMIKVDKPGATKGDDPTKDPAKGDPNKTPGLDPGADKAIAELLGRTNRKQIHDLAETVGGTPGDGGGQETGGPHTKGGEDDGDGDGKGKGKGHKGHFKATTTVIDTGGDRPSVCMGSGCKGGGGPTTITPLGPTQKDDDPNTLTAKQVDEVIRRAQHRLTVCYQRQVDHDKTLGGTLSVRFVIKSDGSVDTARVTASNLRNDDVGSCVATSISLLHFPQSKGGAVVNYPFVFELH
jgi:hypothetical protein